MARRHRRRSLGDPEAHIDAAFRAADDGDCARVRKHLDQAEGEGASVARHRKQLLQSCSAGFGDLKFREGRFVNRYTVGALALGWWLRGRL